jgi:hypothetical protein
VPPFDGAWAVPYLSCDCDPADFVFRTLAPLPGYAEPRATSRRVRTVDKNRRIEGNDWDRVLTVTVRPGVYHALRAVPLTGLTRYGPVRFLDDSSEGEPVEQLVVRKGQAVETVSGGGEGAVMVRIEGAVYLSDGGELWGDAFQEVDPVVEAVWFRLTPKPGRPAAWVQGRWRPDDPAGAPNLEMLCNTHAIDC